MKWSDIWKFVLTWLVSAGGVGAVIMAVVKKSSDIFADRLSKKYENDLQKSLEAYKVKLGGDAHISKAVFDKEFEIYQSLLQIIAEIETDLSVIHGFNLSPERVIATDDLRNMNVDELWRQYNNGGIVTDKQLKNLLTAVSEKGMNLRTQLSYTSALIPQKNWVLFFNMSKSIHTYVYDQSDDNYMIMMHTKEKLQVELREYLTKLKVIS